MHLGIQMEAVESGSASFPSTTAGGTPAQRGREESAAVAGWTIAATTFDPTRMSVYFEFANEDAFRVPGLEDALVRDMRASLRERMDYVVFKGDAGANENTADIAGLDTIGITETEIAQADKVKGPETLSVFANMIDGKYAEGLSDLNVVTAVGATRLWLSTVINSAAENQTLAQFLMASGLSWKARGGIEVNTAADDFAAFVSLQRGIMGAGLCPVWQGAELIRDKWSGAKAGQVQLTLHSYWNFGLIRTANFRRVAFAA